MGKLRANFNKCELSLVGRRSDREEYAVITFDKPGLAQQYREGSRPRQMQIVVPPVDGDGGPIPLKGDGLTSQLKEEPPKGSFSLGTKQPTYENGNYRLNFRGRVTIPSVKNFQIIDETDPETVVLQFGKVGSDRFHMDFRAPLTCFQAFAIVLAQFNF